MRYVLNEDYRLRGYSKLPTGLPHMPSGKVRFFKEQEYRVLLNCNGAHSFESESMAEEDKQFLQRLKDAKVIRPAMLGEFLLPEQNHVLYPAEYHSDCHWSITGCCNLKCRHCFMSAPHAKHGSPSWEQLINIADQLAECGVFRVGITGGEPLIRGDFLPLLDELAKREIIVTVIYTNGYLVNETLLDELEKRHMHPAFQLSHDGIGQHDFLRGVEGAEERTINALKLLQERDYDVSVSMCLHKNNVSTIRETVRLMRSLGVRNMKVDPMMPLGEWAQPEMQKLYLSPAEANEAFCNYIPRYFEDDAPVDIMLGGAFEFDKGRGPWRIYNVQECPVSEEGKVPSCRILMHSFYISAEGRVAPCMGMDDCSYAVIFPNLFEQPLREILSDSPFTKLGRATVKDIRDANPGCRGCDYIDRCSGGCRNIALTKGDDFYGIDTELCEFFSGNWDKKIADAAEPAYQAYCLRHPEQKKEKNRKEGNEENPDFC